MPHTTQDKEVLNRRDALKTLAAVTGAVALTGLPKHWQTPLIEVGALPAHACVSDTPPFAESGQIIASATWSPAIDDGTLYLDIATGSNCDDIDFLVTDETGSGTGPLTVNGSGFGAGSYVIDLDNGTPTALNASVTVTTEFGTTTFSGTVPPYSLAVFTRITLPGGGCGGGFEVWCENGDEQESAGLGRRGR